MGNAGPGFADGPSLGTRIVLPPRVMQPDTFQSLGVEATNALHASDQILGRVLGQASTLDPNALDASFETDVSPAIDAASGLGDAIDTSLLDDAFAAVDEVLGETVDQLADLPDPDEPDGTLPDNPPNVDDPGAGIDSPPGGGTRTPGPGDGGGPPPPPPPGDGGNGGVHPPPPPPPPDGGDTGTTTPPAGGGGGGGDRGGREPRGREA